MPLVDLPLEKLHHYQGLSPRPGDFDAFWDRSLAEMKALDPKVDLVPAAFQAPFADCHDLYFTGVGGSRIHAKLLRPKASAGLQPAVVQFHGYTGSCGDWQGKLALVAAGFTVAALDCRGQGGRSEDRGGVSGTTHNGHIIRGLDGAPEGLLFRQIFLDTAQLAGIVMGLPGVDATRVAAMGGSQGGALAIACAALEPRIRRLATVFPFLSDYRRVWEMDQAKDAYAELKTYFRNFDPLHEREDEIFMKLGYIDIQNLAPRIKAETVMSVGLMDSVCPPSTQFAAYNKITAPKSLRIYPDFGHEGLPGNDDAIFQFVTRPY
ncbi:cephalosporin-C deacetylase [Verrucomicrobium sp. GAS474]|uniref:acetylxylan esterase n=1 Tax=Verrucomicrobium sp. GAS474 TaxID=1882831 RepID=UPI00087A3654|nr:alpha/beta fold hydrolase [Verrucomicrobium sp. GAS474]SDU27096.1 cephalosporin-C deacetylase [Verrucomicrobium sp. GAS474]